MLCCSDCTVETEITLTAIIFIDNSVQKANKLQQYAQKHLRKMQIKSNNHHQLSGQHKDINKENLQTLNQKQQNINNIDLLKTKRKRHPLSTHNIAVDNRGNTDCQTGRFNLPIDSHISIKGSQSRKSIEQSDCRRNMESKTTSFGSLASRRSTGQFFKERELAMLKESLQNLKQEQLDLLRSKLQKQYLYKRQFLKIDKLKDELKQKSKDREHQLSQLRKLFTKNKLQTQQ